MRLLFEVNFVISGVYICCYRLVSDHNLLAILSRGHVVACLVYLFVYFGLVLTSDLDPGSRAVTLGLFMNLVLRFL